jgi:hypothetical protein
MRALMTRVALDDAVALRQRAREFALMAGEARDPVVVIELRSLAREYERHADALEDAGAAAPLERRRARGD